MENAVEMMTTTHVQDDAALDAQNPQTLADVIGDTPAAEPQPESAPAAAEQAPKEPGWMKHRIGAAVNKAVAEAEARIRAEYEAQLAPLREAQLEREADALVAAGTIKDRDIALEYVRNKKGMPQQTPATPATPARDERGRFVAQPDNAAVQQRANMLVAQADNIKQATGVDVMALYNTDPDVRSRILSGEWDFTNVLTMAQVQTTTDPAPTAPPAPVRSANGLGMGGASFRRMSSEQFAKVNEMLESGVKLNM